MNNYIPYVNMCLYCQHGIMWMDLHCYGMTSKGSRQIPCLKHDVMVNTCGVCDNYA